MSKPGKVKYDFDRGFQRKLLGIMIQDPKFLTQYVDAIDESYFTERVHQILAALTVQYFRKYQRRPTKTTFLDMLNRWISKKQQMSAEDSEELKEEARKICSINVSEDTDYIANQAVHFARLQAFKLALIDSTESLEDALHDPEKLANIIPRIQKAYSVGSGRDAGIQFFEHLSDPKKFIESDPAFDPARKVPTGYKTLDKHLNGGLGAGELATAGGEPGVGKSLFLANLAAAGIVAGKKVVYITLELSPHDVYARVLMRLTGLKYEQLSDDSLYTDRMKRLFKRMSKTGYFRIREMPPGVTTCQHIRSYLSHLQVEDEVTPDLLIIDYADEMKDEESKRLVSNSDSDYTAYGNIYTGLIRIAKDFKIPIWTASQINRAGYNQEVVDMAFFADSMKKVMKADVVIGLCREFIKEGKKAIPVAGKLNLFAAKVRRGKSRFLINCIVRESRSIIKEAPNGQSNRSFKQLDDTQDISETKISEIGVGPKVVEETEHVGNVLYLDQQKKKVEA